MEKNTTPVTQFLNPPLTELLQETGGPCLSMIIPLEKLNPQREANKRLTEDLLNKARKAAPPIYSDATIEKIIEEASKICEQLDWVHPPTGLGIYLSEKYVFKVPFDFTPQERIYWSNRFMIRDLLLQDQLNQPFFILALTETKSRFYEYKSGQWNVIKDPAVHSNYQPHYEYEAPARGTSHAGHAHVKSFEREKEKLNADHRKPHLNKIKAALRKYQSATLPVVVVGSDKLLHEINIEHSVQEPIINISKDPSHYTIAELGSIATPYVFGFVEHKIEKLIAEWSELVGKGFTRTGLQAAWRASQEGNCRILLVEKSYVKPGYLLQDPYYLLLSPPVGAHATLPDAVDDLIKMVLQKGGTVFFTDNELLQHAQHIALITRY
jgi:hypothetical protein